MEKTEKYISLFDYLGKAAGKELGEKVYKISKICKVQTHLRTVSNKKYSGDVRLYPENFLKKAMDMVLSPLSDKDELPF